MSKQFLGVIVAVVLVFVGIFVLTGNKEAKSPGKASKGTLSQHVQGKGTAGVTLIEYGDFQCPYCGQYYPVLKQVKAKYGDQIKFQFRNFPLISLHQNAFAAARAAEAAALQNKFWEMHNVLYENQQQWSDSTNVIPFFEQYAKQISLNTAQFKQDFASSKVNDVVNADIAEATRLGLTGTPSFFLNGKKVEIGQGLESFEKIIDAEIAKKAPATKNDSSSPAQ